MLCMQMSPFVCHFFPLTFSVKFDKIEQLTAQTNHMIKTTALKRKQPSLKALLRAVASSTAVETGQNVAQLEQKLRQPSQRFAHIKLAR
jgi:hypothetical protein